MELTLSISNTLQSSFNFLDVGKEPLQNRTNFKTRNVNNSPPTNNLNFVKVLTLAGLAREWPLLRVPTVASVARFLLLDQRNLRLRTGLFLRRTEDLRFQRTRRVSSRARP